MRVFPSFDSILLTRHVVSVSSRNAMNAPLQKYVPLASGIFTDCPLKYSLSDFRPDDHVGHDQRLQDWRMRMICAILEECVMLPNLSDC